MSFYQENYKWSDFIKKPWIIEQSVIRTCFGYPGFIHEWIYYSSHDTEQEARKQLLHLNSLSDFKSEYRIAENTFVSWNAR